MPMTGIGQARGDFGGDVGRRAFEHDGKGSRSGQRLSVGDEVFGGLARASLAL
jgi:hypothetical protein